MIGFWSESRSFWDILVVPNPYAKLGNQIAVYAACASVRVRADSLMAANHVLDRLFISSSCAGVELIGDFICPRVQCATSQGKWLIGT